MNHKRAVAFLLGGSVILCSAIFRIPQANAVTVNQLDRIASELVTVSGYDIRGEIQSDWNSSGGVAAISHNGNRSTIYVSPAKMSSLKTNTWAFILGHELSHQILDHRSSSACDEFSADRLGARLAVRADYSVRDYIVWMYTNSNSCSLTHGCFHNRARRLENYFGIDTGHYDSDHDDHKQATGLPGGSGCF